MSLNVVHGESRNRTAAEGLAAHLRTVVDDGTLYLGYPVLTTSDQRVEVDALLVSQARGLVAFLLADALPSSLEAWHEITAQQDTLFAVLEGNLRRHESLRAGRQLAVSLNTATVFALPVADGPEPADGSFYGSMDEVAEWIGGLRGIDSSLEHNLNAALQRVTTIKPPKKRTSVVSPTSRGAVLKEIERGIANLDQWQQSAAIESPEGPQRIRGLAGSGKTVVLALKAAYWHAQHPDWHIALTFQSRALYQQIDDLVTRFTFEHSNDRPDPERLRIIHSWGSRSRLGVYSLIAEALAETPRDWAYARGKYGQDGAFQGVCQELLGVARTQPVAPIFDAVLIDEAQDLPPEFFQLVYLFTKEPKRIVWGYDELQKLSESAMLTTDELFGTGPGGESLVSLVSPPEGPKRDIVLPVCYRNTPWALATAHALGIGVYREAGLLQHPDEPSVWGAIGYDVVHGALVSGSPVTLKRSRESYPAYFDRLLTPADAVIIRSFESEREQDAWVASQIAGNLEVDELEHDDILIVLPDTYRAKSRAPKLIAELGRKGIDSHLVGVSTSVDEVFQPGSIAIAHIYRAKGNEAPMVYAVDSQYAVSDFNAVTRRNTLFTAITRSRAWVRVTGWGEGMPAIASEAATIVEHDFQLRFTIPTAAELVELRHIHRDRSVGEEESIRKATEGLAAFLLAIERGEVDFQDLPPAMRTRLTMRVQGDAGGDDS
jgi:superfamily I DNA and RNA helicase